MPTERGTERSRIGMAGHLYSFALKKRMRLFTTVLQVTCMHIINLDYVLKFLYMIFHLRTAAQKVGRLSIVMKSAVLQMQGVYVHACKHARLCVCVCVCVCTCLRTCMYSASLYMFVYMFALPHVCISTEFVISFV